LNLKSRLRDESNKPRTCLDRKDLLFDTRNAVLIDLLQYGCVNTTTINVNLVIAAISFSLLASRFHYCQTFVHFPTPEIALLCTYNNLLRSSKHRQMLVLLNLTATRGWTNLTATRGWTNNHSIIIHRHSFCIVGTSITNISSFPLNIIHNRSYSLPNIQTFAAYI